MSPSGKIRNSGKKETNSWILHISFQHPSYFLLFETPCLLVVRANPDEASNDVDTSRGRIWNTISGCNGKDGWAERQGTGKLFGREKTKAKVVFQFVIKHSRNNKCKRAGRSGLLLLANHSHHFLDNWASQGKMSGMSYWLQIANKSHPSCKPVRPLRHWFNLWFQCSYSSTSNPRHQSYTLTRANNPKSRWYFPHSGAKNISKLSLLFSFIFPPVLLFPAKEKTWELPIGSVRECPRRSSGGDSVSKELLFGQISVMVGLEVTIKKALKSHTQRLKDSQWSRIWTKDCCRNVRTSCGLSSSSSGLEIFSSSLVLNFAEIWKFLKVNVLSVYNLNCCI